MKKHAFLMIAVITFPLTALTIDAKVYSGSICKTSASNNTNQIRHLAYGQFEMGGNQVLNFVTCPIIRDNVSKRYPSKVVVWTLDQNSGVNFECFFRASYINNSNQFKHYSRSLGLTNGSSSMTYDNWPSTFPTSSSYTWTIFCEVPPPNPGNLERSVIQSIRVEEF